MTLRVIGTHCYLGGFLLGLQSAGLNIVASAETWKPGAKGASALGLPIKTLEEILSNPPDADMVVGNPPCSRFSHLSLSFFKNKEGAHEDPETFPEIGQLREVALSTGARILWWETGPLAWSLGRDLIRGYHDSLRIYWGEITTLIIRLDLRYIGVPQRRPRVHIIHMATTEYPPPFAPPPQWPIIPTIGEWIAAQVDGRELSNPVVVFKIGEVVEDPLHWAHEQDEKQKFRSMVPKVIRYSDPDAYAVVSRRVMVWKEDNRWWDFLEYAALMTYPLDESLRLLKLKKRSVDAEILLSKSVAPAASKWVAENVLFPWLDNAHPGNRNLSWSDDAARMIPPHKWGTNLWELDLRVKDTRRRKRRQHDKRQLSLWDASR